MKSKIKLTAHWYGNGLAIRNRWYNNVPNRYFLILLLSILVSCESFVAVDLPQSQLVRESVFTDRTTADAALADIYAQLRDYGLLTGGSSGMGNMLGLYSDELDFYGSPDRPEGQFLSHSLLGTNRSTAAWWDYAYQMIYQINALIEGVSRSDTLSAEDVDTLKGEGLFLRAYIHMFLTELFGDIPYVDTTDYQVNKQLSRTARIVVYEHVVKDLLESVSLLPDGDTTGERSRPNGRVALAVLARAYLYTEQWELARATVDKALAPGGYASWEPDLEKVFKKDSHGTLWQFRPETEGINTKEAFYYIFLEGPPTSSALSPLLVTDFEEGDNRLSHWIGQIADGSEVWYYPHKYKIRGNSGASEEYSIIIRLAELYLIRAEARFQLGDSIGAKEDLKLIRTRAGLTTIEDGVDLQIAILRERRFELFTEFGHRWFDLKRTGNAAAILGSLKPGWKNTDLLFPLPESEILANTNLGPQNPGY